MKASLYSIAILLLLLMISCTSSFAQTDTCITNLKKANTYFEEGNHDAVIRLLNSSLSYCQLGKDEKIQAHKLLILSYYAIDNLEAADKSAANIMKLDPNYKPDKFKDDPKLSAIFSKYK